MVTREYWMNPVAVICTTLFVQALPCIGKTVFMIGNSFTHNSMPYSLPAIAAQKSDSLTAGAHINSGSPVHNIWGRPDDGREISKDFGKYRDALTKHQWDVVTLQPFYKRPSEGFPQSTMQSDIDSILMFIELARENPANRKTRFYIYESWPFLWTGKPFQQAWDAATKDELTAPTMHTRVYYEHLLKRLREKTDAEIHMIPVPEVMYQLDKQMQAGQVPGLTGLGDIMKDKLHLDPGLGHYIASVTVYATLFGKNPGGLVKPEGHYDDGNTELLTPQMCEIVNKTAWDVVSMNPSTESVVLFNHGTAPPDGPLTTETCQAAWPTDVLNTERHPCKPGQFTPEQTWQGKIFRMGYEHCDCLARHWFWEASDTPRQSSELHALYRDVIAAGGNLLLNVAPDKTGRIPDSSVGALMELKKAIDDPK